MTNTSKAWIIFLLFLILLFGFYAGKYKEWETDSTKITSKGTILKDWQIAGILGIITIIGVITRLPTSKQ